MQKVIYTSVLTVVLTLSVHAFAGSMDDDLQALCMQDEVNTAENCGCAVSLVKSSMESREYTLLHALATTERDSEDQINKITALKATPEEMQGIGEKFQTLAGEVKTKCNVTIQNNDQEGEG